MLRSLSTFLVLFRAALRLHEETVPALKLDALERLNKYLKFDAGPFRQLAELKEQRRAGREVAADVSFADYLTAIETVAAAINHSTHP